MAVSATAELAEPEVNPGVKLTHRQIMVVLSGLLLGMFLAALDQTIVSTSMRTIADQLHGQTMQAWATTAYLITGTITTPLYGKLSDIYGRKPLFLTAIAIFLVGSGLSALSTDMYQLAAFRAVQGLGAGGLMALALAIIGDMVSPRERARYQGFFVAVFGISSVAGPVLGGLFAGLDSFAGVAGWRWVFLINLPLGLIALVVVTRVLNLPHKRVDHKVDYWGAVLLTVGLVPLLIVAEQGREWGWGSTRSIALIVAAVFGILLFILVELRQGDEALLPMRLFKSPVFSLANTLNFIIGMGMFGGLAGLPLYLQIVHGFSPTKAGLALLPLMLGIMTATAISGQIISRTGRYKIFPVIGSGLMALALFLLSTVGVDTEVWQVMIMMLIMGAGLGQCMQTLVLAVQNDAAPSDMGVATASATFFRQMGGTMGTAVFLSILFGVIGDRISDAITVAKTDPAFLRAMADPENQKLLQNHDLNDTTFLNGLDPVVARPFLEGFASSIDTMFFVGGCVTIVAFLLVWFLREKPLTNQSGMERAAALALAE
ncbi:DHA2 family efflux MFS transporter permease subunit [Pseudonocardiaceae bacterium YIM PH 21723]|nr:DHA2 family efflux MFS transporter permease subunit [Pseudonocardiaceae bacterium YIM PH 21723]